MVAIERDNLSLLGEQFRESARLEAEIMANLRRLGYEV